MKYYKDCSLCDCLNEFISGSSSPVAVVIYVNEKKAGEEFFNDLKFFEDLGKLSIHGENVEWIPSAFDNLRGFIMNYGVHVKAYFKDGKCVVVPLNPGFDVFNKGPKKSYLFEALKEWGANGILEINVEADRTFLTTVE
ncbi:hypothetical protein IKF04_01795 [Candidatus Saccharibacteria bacterium]|nr:hypothetical protein [Candidatus Saccharibacteria bacterium]